jgi:endonuclease/exonuclease/phosphatase family metal-dependent hydrolase
MGRTLRLVSYNILEGFRPLPSGKADRRGVDRARVDAARAVIGALDPDILVLNEALFCRQFSGRCVDYGAMLGFPHQAAALYDEAWGNAILSRHAIVHSQQMRIYNRGGLRAVIATQSGEVTVASYHPHPRRMPAHKAADFRRLIADVSGPLIVCGDLNGISPEDAIDRAALIAAFGAFTNEPEAAVDRFIESGRLVFGALNALGLRDAVPLPGRRFTMPTDLINLDKGSAMRIDHILANEEISIAGGEVVHSAASNRASDHHPVMVEFTICAGASTSMVDGAANTAGGGFAERQADG